MNKTSQRNLFLEVDNMKTIAEEGGGVIYEGLRRQSGPQVIRMEIAADGKYKTEFLDPAPSQALYNHSPDGFEWGYCGSGPAQLALALILDAAGDKELALKYHQEFKERFVAGWGTYWRMNAGQVRCWAKLRQFSEREEMRYKPDARD